MKSTVVTTRGGSSLMPSHSQGTERRPERRAERTGFRPAPRALVVGRPAGTPRPPIGSSTHAWIKATATASTKASPPVR